ncbi:TPA: preprotein translocase subunit SecE [candidate division WWE3 bacterium]|uniref:Protein translocase subunit SecE n=3 Tax=Katanobacteria TaxID=422282 RepID=A0A0G1JNU3_UNCKA|nr:MAG: Preprotein translocase, SecE subunit [candidate division WWE3 bacterium GW2011_GWA2_44_16]OGC51401.1 MAG: preprotein translocase subunit SecE [candidate division WWE3 bacterium RIFCSPHIGHO2_01_FULL_43_9]HAZ29190.1 preprotein translocase subunit SecE [candidate division WWE3 bacterium]
MVDIVNYFGEVREEFKHVTWPSKKEAARLTVYVVGGSLLVGLFVGGVDSVFAEALKYLLVGD